MTTTARLGFWAASAATCASLAYVVAQLLQALGVVRDPVDRILIFGPSLMLAPLVVVTLAAAYDISSAAVRGWRIAALGLALLYAAMVGLVYVTQLGVVIPDELRGLHDEGWVCCAFSEPMTAIDLLGYTYMALALLLLAPSYPAGWLRRLLIANGLLAPIILLQLVWPVLILAAVPWLIIFPAATLLIARDFARMMRSSRKIAAARQGSPARIGHDA